METWEIKAAVFPRENSRGKLVKLYDSSRESAYTTGAGRTRGLGGGAHCTEIDFALSFGAVIVKMIDLSKTESRNFFGILLGQEKSQKLYLLPKSR